MQHPFCIVYILFSLLVRVHSLWAGPPAHVVENSAAETPPVVICTRVFNEGPYLHEWIEWHRMLGIEMFMIYDDGSTDDTPYILGQYAHAGVVTVMNHSGGTQRHVFEHCRERMQQAPMNGKAWILTHDLDEFLWIDRQSLLLEVLEAKRAKNIKQLHIGRLHFGSSGLACYDSRPVVKRFLHRFDAAACEERQNQSELGLWGAAEIPKPAKVQNDICNKGDAQHRNGSFVEYKSISWVADVKPNAGIGPHRHPMVRKNMEAGTIDDGPMVLLHYKTKSHQEFVSRATSQNRPKYESGLEKTFEAQDRNDVEDRRALDYAEELEERLQKVRGPVAARGYPPCRAGGRQ